MKHKAKFLKAVAYGLAMKTNILGLKFLYKKNLELQQYYDYKKADRLGSALYETLINYIRSDKKAVDIINADWYTSDNFADKEYVITKCYEWLASFYDSDLKITVKEENKRSHYNWFENEIVHYTKKHQDFSDELETILHEFGHYLQDIGKSSLPKMASKLSQKYYVNDESSDDDPGFLKKTYNIRSSIYRISILEGESIQLGKQADRFRDYSYRAPKKENSVYSDILLTHRGLAYD